MNIKPTVQIVFQEVGQSQDGNRINPSDHYGRFLTELIKDNTETKVTAIDAGEVDTEELADNLRYAIDQFKRALKAVESLNKQYP